jgi:hypothetical protein
LLWVAERACLKLRFLSRLDPRRLARRVNVIGRLVLRQTLILG